MFHASVPLFTVDHRSICPLWALMNGLAWSGTEWFWIFLRWQFVFCNLQLALCLSDFWFYFRFSWLSGHGILWRTQNAKLTVIKHYILTLLKHHNNVVRNIIILYYEIMFHEIWTRSCLCRFVGFIMTVLIGFIHCCYTTGMYAPLSSANMGKSSTYVSFLLRQTIKFSGINDMFFLIKHISA